MIGISKIDHAFNLISVLITFPFKISAGPNQGGHYRGCIRMFRGISTLMPAWQVLYIDRTKMDNNGIKMR